MFDSLAALASSRPKRVIAVAAIFFAAGGIASSGLADRLDPYGADDPATESVKANGRLDALGYHGVSTTVLIQRSPGTTKGRTRIAEITNLLRARDDVASVTGYADTRSPDFLSHNGRSTYLAVAVKPTDDKAEQEAAQGIADQLDGQPGVKVGGPALAQRQVNDIVEDDLRRAELLAFPLLFLLSLFFFRSAVAALLPPLIGALAIVGTFLALRIASEVGSVSIFALNLTTGIGLGLAIDYSLFIVSRYREEIADNGPGPDAMLRTLRTAGRTVLFSSLTVAAALAALLVFPQRFLYSMGLGGSIVALLAAAVSLTVLPAVLSLLGHRVNSLAPAFLQRRAEREAHEVEGGFWYRLSRFVMRRPIPVATAAVILLIVLAIPGLGTKFTYVDAGILPDTTSARQVDDELRAQFPPFRDTPVELLVSGATQPRLRQLAGQLRDVEGIDALGPTTQLRNGNAVALAYLDSTYISQRSRDAVKTIRSLPAPRGTSVEVTGGTAEFVDFQSSLTSHLPIALAIIVIATIVVLFLMTGSIVLPVKSLLMNVLNVGAVFGILVWVFQDGRLESFLGYTSQGALEQTMPILAFAIVFGLSTDYAVFLLSRIKEARDSGVSDSESVAVGLERTGRIVTAAALLFAIAIGAFATSRIIFIKENGVGTALAVLIDATIIRALLVPSLMELLGKWNWWAPGPLRRLHERIGLSESSNNGNGSSSKQGTAA